MTLAQRIRDGDRRALARGLTLVESESAEGTDLLATLGPSGAAHRVGITGPPGAGKSTLVSALATAWRKQGRRVGILAVDPTSPFTGGALLGDRIRMLAHTGDDGVFIRSLASRGALGGLSVAAYDAADLLEAAGFDPVVVETVGVGQGEVEICRAADTTVVVLAPGAGDVVQGMKAGLIEIADVLVVNQADREGAPALQAALAGALEVRDAPAPPLLSTIATKGDGVDALRRLLDGRLEDASEGIVLANRRRARARARIRASVDRHRSARFWKAREEALDDAAREVAAGTLTPAQAVARMLEGEDR